MKQLVAFGFWLWLFCVAITKSFGQNPPYKAVNLGGWLVVEGWMTPSLFDAIPNKDLLDGTQVQLKSTSLNMYVSAENGGGLDLVANRPTASGWETFRGSEQRLHWSGSSDQGKRAFARTTEAGEDETFVIVRNNENPLRAVSGDSVRGDYGGSADDWSDQNPSVFQMSIVGTLQGEYQLTNGYGPDKAPSVMKNHWDTYIIADDFRFMSENGLTAVRIPVGWWIMHDPDPPKPFVGGSLQALDNAFTWAE
ncbi:hypothetical protein Sango_2089900 [Sesamum angolense]|uniref:DUF7910 domain-containing protein n=1 Tax=Sesamum angolense TaxID=2727404 RepID=A0AAE1WBG6_9LAMI|nr:hypothetical protein Sango_2089900 [Sesamum angolense]